MLLILLVPIIGSAAAFPLPDDGRRSAGEKSLFISTETRGNVDTGNPRDLGKTMEDQFDKTLLSEPVRPTTTDVRPEEASDVTETQETGRRKTTQERKRKAVFVDYSPIPRMPHPLLHPATYEIDYDDGNPTIVERPAGGSKRSYQESNIIYIRLPATPYIFVPGFGYISQSPKYSTVATDGLKSQLVPVVAQLPQQLLLSASHARPTKQPAQPTASLQSVDPFIKLPIDFVSNGKPTSVYQWRQKPDKRPVDSPITKLDSLSADFVSNGKPTSIYQWQQANLKPSKRPDVGSLNSLDMGPYKFNGKPTSLYLLGPDGSSAMHQPVRPADYQDDYRTVFY
ncbi:PREDICTED: uncharacterized protein LOC106750305 [Dinoponera quadriceps]|uniref:Uncharacterized protein LOC106750305 n=1 Tax=Dinoponera quadriceps TaxID=609295 RepID=A0A6P3Y597_DINQU|nr:PREDICTED: uncharacterized protein LOC106750305 [Dinoponera quadriceps]